MSDIVKHNEEQKDYSIVVYKEDDKLLYCQDFKVIDVVKADIPEKHKQVLLATLHNPKIRTLDLTERQPAYNELVKIIAKTIWETRFKFHDDAERDELEQQLLISSVIEEIRLDFGHLTLEDIRLAFRNGVRKRYGDFFGLSVMAFVGFLEGYVNQTKVEAMGSLQKVKPLELEEAKKKEPTEEELKKIEESWFDNVYAEYKHFRRTGEYKLFDFNNKFYHYAKKIGLINLSEKERKKIWVQATIEYRRELQPNNTKSFGGRIDLRNALKALEKGGDKTTEIKIAVIARRIAVKNLFKRLVAQEKDLREVIDLITKKIINLQTRNTHSEQE